MPPTILDMPRVPVGFLGNTGHHAHGTGTPGFLTIPAHNCKSTGNRYAERGACAQADLQRWLGLARVVTRVLELPIVVGFQIKHRQSISRHASATITLCHSRRPNGDQSNEQLERDREACHRWAVQQVGFDPTTAAPKIKASDRSVATLANYLRADAACLEARDYRVE